MCTRHRVTHNLCYNGSRYTSKDSKVLSTPINQISCSKEVLSLYWYTRIYRLNLALNLVQYVVQATVYQETLTKGKFDEFDESWPNRQTKTIQYFRF